MLPIGLGRGSRPKPKRCGAEKEEFRKFTVQATDSAAENWHINRALTDGRARNEKQIQKKRRQDEPQDLYVQESTDRQAANRVPLRKRGNA
jgi:hypothetical protein